METPELKYKEIQGKSAHGIKWVGVSEALIRIVQFATTLILARLLLPKDFGIIGIALIFTQLANVIFDFGFSTSLIQRKNINDTHFSTTFVVYFFSACVYTPVIIFSAPYIVSFFDMTILGSILPVLSVIFILNALKSIPFVISQREMNFKKYSVIQIYSSLAYSTMSIAFAYFGYGAWSFVYGILAEQGVQTILLNIYFKWKPVFRFDKFVFKELFGYSSNVLGTRLVGYLITNTPAFLIGKFLGVTSLGYYNIGYQLVEFPVQRVSKNVLRVMFPAFSKLQDDLPSFRALYKTTVYHLSLILMPVFAGLILTAPQLVELLYGQKWLPAILPLQILAAAGLFRSVWITTSVIFLSKGAPQIELKINIIFAILLIPLVFWASHLSLVEVATAVSACTCIFLVMAQHKALQLIKMHWSTLLKVYILPVSSVIFFTAIIVFANHFWFYGFSVLFKFILIVVICAGLYAIIISNFDRRIFKKIIQFIKAG